MPPKVINFANEFTNYLTDPNNRQLLRDSICGHLTEEIQSLKASLAVKEKEIKDLKDVMKTLEDKTDPLEERIATLEEKVEKLTKMNERVDALEERAVTLESKQDDLEQYTRRNSVRISGISETPNEDIYTRTIETLNTAMVLNPPLDVSHIDRLHRVGRSKSDGTPRQVLVKFTSYQHRQRIMKKRSVLKNAGSPLFINEDLTKKRANLLWCCRRAKHNLQLKDCWTSDGRVLIKDLSDNILRVIDQPQLQERINRTTAD